MPARLKLMRASLRLTVLLCLMLLCGAPATQAQELEVTLDPTQTEIHYTLGATAHTVHGTFRLKNGVVRYDPATGRASGSVIVDATSGSSGNDGRDSRMHREILESPKFPEIVFTPQTVKGTVNPQGMSRVEVSGTFRLHGQDQETTLPVSIELTNGQATAATQFSLPYQKWGLKNPSTFILRVKDTVEIEIHAVARVDAMK